MLHRYEKKRRDLRYRARNCARVCVVVKRLLSQNNVNDTIFRANERTNERTKVKSPQNKDLHLSTYRRASNAARPLVVDPEPPPPLDDEDEGRPDALEEEGLPNSLLNMMNVRRKRFFL